MDELERGDSAPSNIVVLGDAVVDEWLRGSCERLSREGPVPVVDVERREKCAGAAANTAVNLAALGSSVELVSAVGDDATGTALVQKLVDFGVGTEHLVTVPGWTTPSKHRVMAADHILVRWDESAGSVLPEWTFHRLATALADAVHGADALVICDYDMSVASRLRSVVGKLRAGIPLLVVDAHHLGRWRSVHPDLVTPNASEAFAALDGTGAAPAGEQRVPYFAEHRSSLLSATGAAAAVVTLDRDGAVFFDQHDIHRTRAHPAPEENCAGAGDTFTAAMTVALIRGRSPRDAADFAQRAANSVTAQPGTTVCWSDQIDGSDLHQATLAADELMERVAEHRAAGQRIVLTNGCFDVMHRGHVTLLEEAKAAGDVLVVAINDDDSVTALKGPGRPINGAADRAALVGSLGCVDYVTVFSEETPVNLIRRVKPDVYVKGGDYSRDMLAETPVVEECGGQVRILGYVADHSTTGTIERIAARGMR